MTDVITSIVPVQRFRLVVQVLDLTQRHELTALLQKRFSRLALFSRMGDGDGPGIIVAEGHEADVEAVRAFAVDWLRPVGDILH